MAKKAKGGTAALQLLQREDVAHQVHNFEGGSDHFGEHAAQALDVTPERIFKTLVISLKHHGAKDTLAVCCVPVSGHLSLKKAAKELGAVKASMADMQHAARATGYIPGGISPLGQKQQLPTLIDATAEGFSTIFVSGGRRGLDVELAPGDLARLCGARFVDIGAE